MVLICPLLLFAQGSQLRFKHYSINEGLSQNTVFSLLQDSDGMMWIGTEDGLNRFDGYEFTYFKHNLHEPNSISHNQVNALHEDSTGIIWIGTSDGLNLFDKHTEKFTRISTSASRSVASNEFVTSIFEDSKRNLWITTFEGLKLYNPRTKKFQSFRYQNGARSDRIMEDKNGMLWVSINRDLRRFDPQKKIFLPLPQVLENNSALRGSFIRAIKQDKHGQVWIATETAGVFVYDERDNSVQQFTNNSGDKGIPANIVREIFFYSDNEVWLGTRDGLTIYNRSNKQFHTYKNDRYDPLSISQNSIRSIMRDKAGNIWVATYAGGVNLVTTDYNMFGYVGAATVNKPGLNYQMASAITGAYNNGLWIGTEGGGINWVSNEHNVFKSYSMPQVSANIGINTIKCFLPDDDKIWVGTVNGIGYINKSGGMLQPVQIPVENKEINSIVKINGDLWLGSMGSGLIKKQQDGTFVVFKNELRNPNSLSRDNVLKIIKDDKNNLWIATYKGLNYFDHQKFTQYHHNPGDPFSVSHSHISTLYIDAKKRLWVGTKGGGLNLFDAATKRFYVIDHNIGLVNDVVQSIEEDMQGNLWVSTNKGLSKISLKGNPPFTRRNTEIQNYFAEDGLQGNQFFANSSYRNNKGELFFGGINGVTFFHPNNIRKNGYKPPVVITEFLIRNKPVRTYGDDSPLKHAINETEAITLNYDQAFISFRFAALNYINPNKNQYAYRLKGFENDEDWNYVGSQRLATYTNLDAGTYYFQVIASNNDGVWNTNPRTIKIVVLPPWWATWSAYALYFLFTGGLLYLYYWYSLRNERLKNELVLEHVIREKDHELYQRKLNFFTNISHEIKTPLTLILAPLDKLLQVSHDNNQVHHRLMVMKRSGERLLRLITQLLDFRKFESGNMELEASESNLVQFVRDVVSAFESYAKEVDVKIKTEAPRKDIKVYFDQDKFEKVLYNLLSNALKFSKPGGKIILRIKEEKPAGSEPGFAIVEVEDNGVGIPPEKLPHIFQQFRHYDQDGMNVHGSGIGLAFAKGLVELHTGKLTVMSEPAAEGQPGLTRFTIRLPLGRVHLKDEEIVTVGDGENIEWYLSDEHKARTNEFLAKKTAKVLTNMDESPLMLLVEDNKDVLEFLREHFEDKFRIYTASDGVEGVAKAVEVIPDIIISDVMMPNMTGTILASTLKNDSRTSHIPIILLTARTQTIHKIEGLECGADDYVTKPFNISILEARVWNLIEQRQQLRERYRREITLQPSKLAISSPDEAFLEKVMTYIEENLSESNLNVEDLAKEVFMSRTTLYRKIKALTNQTIVEFIRSVKLKRAAQLLETGNYRITEVAYMTGFSEINYFRKCFKEQYEQTPTEYMQAHAKQSLD